MAKIGRKILVYLDNATVHPQNVELHNIELKFLPPNTTAKSQVSDEELGVEGKSHAATFFSF